MFEHCYGEPWLGSERNRGYRLFEFRILFDIVDMPWLSRVPIEGLMLREREVEGERIDGGLELLEGTFGWIDDRNVRAGSGGMRGFDERLFSRDFDSQDSFL
jgi:hypothetical protein